MFKEVLIILCFSLAIFAAGCTTEKQTESNPPIESKANTVTNGQTMQESTSNKSDSDKIQNQSAINQVSIPAKAKEVNQKDAEEVVKAYFKSIEEKNYAKAWELISDKQKKNYSKEDAINKHWGIESLKLISVQKEQLSEELKKRYNDVNETLYNARFIIKSSPNTAWENGETGRLVDLVKQGDGNWYINDLCTGP